VVLGLEVGLSPGNFVLHGDPGPPPQKGGGAPSQLSAHVYCGQTAGWIKMALGTKVGLCPGQIELDGDIAPLRKKGALFILAKGLDASRCHLVQR